MAWADKFAAPKRAEEKEIEKLRAEIEAHRAGIKTGETEIMAGAPSRDFGGVRALKEEVAGHYRELAKKERKIVRLKERMSAK